MFQHFPSKYLGPQFNKSIHGSAEMSAQVYKKELESLPIVIIRDQADEQRLLNCFHVATTPSPKYDVTAVKRATPRSKQMVEQISGITKQHKTTTTVQSQQHIMTRAMYKKLQQQSVEIVSNTSSLQTLR